MGVLGFVLDMLYNQSRSAGTPERADERLELTAYPMRVRVLGLEFVTLAKILFSKPNRHRGICLGHRELPAAQRGLAVMLASFKPVLGVRVYVEKRIKRAFGAA